MRETSKDPQGFAQKSAQSGGPVKLDCVLRLLQTSSSSSHKYLEAVELLRAPLYKILAWAVSPEQNQLPGRSKGLELNLLIQSMFCSVCSSWAIQGSLLKVWLIILGQGRHRNSGRRVILMIVRGFYSPACLAFKSKARIFVRAMAQPALLSRSAIEL